MYRQLAAALGEAGAPLIAAGVAVSNRDDYLLNPRLAVRGGAGGLLPPTRPGPGTPHHCTAARRPPPPRTGVYSRGFSLARMRGPPTPRVPHPPAAPPAPLPPLPPRAQRRYGLSSLGDDELPAFRLFLRGADPRVPLNYTGELKTDEMSGWLVAHTSIFLGKRVRG
jgi:hypothetical protein